PVTDVMNLCNEIGRLTGRKPNKMVVGTDLAVTLLNHSDIKNRIQQSQLGIPTLDLVARIMGLMTIVEARSTRNIAVQNEDSSVTTMSFIADGKSFLLVYANPSSTPTRNQPSGGYYLQWSRMHPQVPTDMGMMVNSLRLPEVEHGDWFEVVDAAQPVIVGPDYGVFASSVIG
ncbi:MAG TPA: hypothetical protein VLV83_24860, partial [Acidobacteriota bacterium]|nr:hypothetical protein [Acidobacteriota bacterium]